MPIGRAPSTPFARVIATGRLDPAGASAYASDVRDVSGAPTFGVFLVEPLIRAGGPPVLVDLGWVPATTTGRPAVTVGGERTIRGYVRTAERGGLFTPTPDRATRQFYALDPATIAADIGLGPVMPFTLVALSGVTDGAFPAPDPTMPRPSNDHLQYAVTWFALAGVVAGMSGAWWFRAWSFRGRSGGDADRRARPTRSGRAARERAIMRRRGGSPS